MKFFKWIRMKYEVWQLNEYGVEKDTCMCGDTITKYGHDGHGQISIYDYVLKGIMKRYEGK